MSKTKERPISVFNDLFLSHESMKLFERYFFNNLTILYS